MVAEVEGTIRSRLLIALLVLIILVVGVRAAWFCTGLVMGRFGLCIDNRGEAKGFREGLAGCFDSIY